MTDKNKRRTRRISYEIMGLLAVTLIISVVIFWLTYVCGIAVIENICESRNVTITDSLIEEIDSWVYNVSLLISVIFFVVLLMFLMGERLAYALRKIEDKERALSQEKEELFRSLSHDIRTPLTSIMAYSEFLLKNENSTLQEYREYMELIRKKGSQIKDLTDVLLEGGKRNLQHFEDAKLLMEQLADDFQSSLEDSFDVKIDLSQCNQFKGSFDVNELIRIFDNLISNIEKYAEPTKSVKLIISSDSNGVDIIQSNEIIVKPTDVESNKIGINSIKRIAHSYGGRVDVSKEDGLFTISISLLDF